MYRYAVINKNKVENIIIADTQEIAEQVTGKTCISVEGLSVGIDYIWDGQDFTNPNDIKIEPTPELEN